MINTDCQWLTTKHYLCVLTVLIATFSFSAKADASVFEVGFRKFEVAYGHEGSTFSMAVLYPSASVAKKVAFGPFQMHVAVGGTPAEGLFPLVIWSHGSGGSNMSYKDTAMSLAQQGFIVAMPLHPNDNFRDNRLQGSLANYINRPKQIQAAIDELLTTSVLNRQINQGEIAVIGHSVGGYSALAVAGGIADTGALIRICRQNMTLKDPYCAPARNGSLLAEVIPVVKDSRIKALVLMAPLGILFSAEGALKQVDIPVLLLQAEKDEELTEPFNTDVIVEGLPNKKMLTLQKITNAGHYAFLNAFPEEIKAELGNIAIDPEGFDRIAFQQTLGLRLADYLNSVFK